MILIQVEQITHPGLNFYRLLEVNKIIHVRELIPVLI